jgi:hypothetical protein
VETWKKWILNRLRLAGGRREQWSGDGATAGVEPERNAAHRAANGSPRVLRFHQISPNEQDGEGEAGAILSAGRSRLLRPAGLGAIKARLIVSTQCFPKKVDPHLANLYVQEHTVGNYNALL